VILGAPRPKGRPRFRVIGKHVTAYTPKETIEAEAEIVRAFRAKYGSDFQPLTGGLTGRVSFYIPIPKSWPKSKHMSALRGIVRPAGRPDLDNLAKLLLDALNGILWVDDAQICRLVIEKRYAELPATVLEVTHADAVEFREAA
jgi:Holliday junction resolvase RusA-like endonuclease